MSFGGIFLAPELSSRVTAFSSPACQRYPANLELVPRQPKHTTISWVDHFVWSKAVCLLVARQLGCESKGRQLTVFALRVQRNHAGTLQTIMYRLNHTT